jgi:hypothetical protein
MTMRRTRSIHRGGHKKPNTMRVKLKLFFKPANPPEEETPENISDELWASVLEDYQETNEVYGNEPQLMEEKVKSYDVKESFGDLMDLGENLLSAQWVAGEFAVELKLKTRLSPEKLKEKLLASPIESYLWHKSEDAWNIWTLNEKYHFAFTDYRKPENIVVTQILPAVGGSRRVTRKSTRKTTRR